MGRRNRNVALAVVVAAATIGMGVSACPSPRREDAPRVGEAELTGAVAPSWQSTTMGWPEGARAAAKEMTDRYGPPDETTPSQLVWLRKGPWKRSVVSREEVKHAWPSEHVDVLEQGIDLRVPTDRFDDLAAFDGSVMAERTKGELSARCGGEAANFLAINLARDVVLGNRTVADARRVYEAQMKAFKAGDRNQELMTGLRFAPPVGGTGDPDTPRSERCEVRR